ncbi:ATP-binding cassette domain-containing protein [Serratia marcescens]|nr:ATP-binding cassette domain-containing protein [Serratia marcescens]
MSEALLSVKRLNVSYGGIHAVKGIDFTVNAGEQVTLIGANGAGKTSSLRALTGLQPFEGDILFDGRSIRGMAPHRLLQQGLVMVLAPIVVEAIFSVIKQLAHDGVTLLLVEQNARLALESTDRAYVLDSGSLSHSGRSADMLDDEKIKQIYLGE